MSSYVSVYDFNNIKHVKFGTLLIVTVNRLDFRRNLGDLEDILP